MPATTGPIGSDREAPPHNNPGCRTVTVSWTVVAAGAVGVVSGKGVSVTKQGGAGLYRLVFDRKHVKLVGFVPGMQQAANAVLTPVIKAQQVTSQANGPGVDIELRVAAGTATDAASGDVVYCRFELDCTGGFNL